MIAAKLCMYELNIKKKKKCYNVFVYIVSSLRADYRICFFYRQDYLEEGFPFKTNARAKQ